jgi:hypothetical protein
MRMKRDRFIGFKVNDYEDRVIRGKARSYKANISTFLRATALTKDIIVIDGIRELLPQLKRIGNNLNQITILFRQNKIDNPDLVIIKKEFATIVYEVKEKLKAI